MLVQGLADWLISNEFYPVNLFENAILVELLVQSVGSKF